MMDAAGEPISVRAVWPEGLSEAAQVANQYALAEDPTSADGIYFLVGHFAAPIFTSPEHAEQRLQQSGGAVTISPRGAFYMTRTNAERLRDLLVYHLQKAPDDTIEAG